MQQTTAPKSKLPLVLKLIGGALLLFMLLLGAVGGFFQYQANKAHRAYEIIGKYVGYGSSLADIPYRKYKNYSTIATLSFVGSGFSFLFGTGALVGGFVAGSRKPQGSSMALQQGYGAPMGDPNLQGSMQPQGMQPQGMQPQGMQPQGMQGMQQPQGMQPQGPQPGMQQGYGPSSDAPTAQSPHAPPPSQAVSSASPSPFGAPPSGFGGPPPGPMGPPPTFSADASPPAAPAPPTPPAPPSPPSDRKFGGTMLMPQADEKK